MSDRLYLSCWVRGFNETNMLRHFGKMVELFPSSKLAQRGPVLRVYAIEYVEPPLLERSFDPGAVAADVIAAARDFVKPDCSVEIDGFWDLWQYDTEWKLRPAAVTLTCFGPDFERDNDDHLRIDFGLESKFLPAAGIEGSLRMGQSNLRSLLHLVGELERALPIDRRVVWSESGANFAELLAQAVAQFSAN
jgi:hypothetical protein